jgi:23S rRNA (guanosine2251-2'-O)-methyltransferase
MTVARVANIAESISKMKDAGIWVVGIEAGQGKNYYDVDFTLPTAIVIGSEGGGLSRLVKERCEVLASIPMMGKISSLNASAATAVVLYEAVRQRRDR